MDPYIETIITDTNAAYYGVDISELMESAGEAIAHLLIKRYGARKSISFVCGLGNNGGDGFAAARHLVKSGVKNVHVYLIGRGKDIKTPAAEAHWKLMKKAGVNYSQDSFSTDIGQSDIVVECLLGTGIKGKLYKRFRDVISRVTHQHSKIVAIDVPVPGYNPDYSISMMYPKTDDAEVVDLPIPDQVRTQTGPGEVRVIAQPKRHSYKSQNGKVLIIGGSEKYHGAPVIAASAAANYAGLVYLYSPIKDQDLLREMSRQSKEYIHVLDSDLKNTAEDADAILFGPGIETNYPNQLLLNGLMKDFSGKPFVVDAGAIGMADLGLAAESQSIIFTPHRGELNMLVDNGKAKQSRLEGALKRFAVENKCYINLKSSTSLLFGPTGQFKLNKSGHAGMAKGGSGDALAGLTAAFAAKNDLWIAMTAAAFANGLAGELAAKEFGSVYSVEELISMQQKAIKLCWE